LFAENKFFSKLTLHTANINSLRFAALMFDWFMSALFGLVLFIITMFSFSAYFTDMTELEQIEWLIYFQILSKPIYFILMEYRYSNTFGKKFFDIQVVNLQEEKITFVQASLRYLLCTLHYVTYGVTLLWIFFNKKRLSLHEQLTKTQVVRIKSNNKISV
jgi:uncharacterized RDD family membrane protein YckC